VTDRWGDKATGGTANPNPAAGAGGDPTATGTTGYTTGGSGPSSAARASDGFGGAAATLFAIGGLVIGFVLGALCSHYFMIARR